MQTNNHHSDELPTREYSGIINLGGKELKCAVLNDGTRVLTATSIFEAFGRPRRGKRTADQNGANMPSFVDANNLKPFNEAVFSSGSNNSLEVVYRSKNGKATYIGYAAEILPKICEVYLRARDVGALTENQKPLAIVSDILMRSLATVGITALIDEATGYQEVRDRDELQKILSAYISKEFLPWTKKFPDEFYIEMFRLKNWQYQGKPKPPIVGKITNEIVYERLPEGVLDELQKKNPYSDGKRKKRHHQLLTTDTGVPHLDKHLTALITLMKISDTWEEFERLLDKSMGESYQTKIEKF